MSGKCLASACKLDASLMQVAKIRITYLFIMKYFRDNLGFQNCLYARKQVAIRKQNGLMISGKKRGETL